MYRNKWFWNIFRFFSALLSRLAQFWLILKLLNLLMRTEQEEKFGLTGMVYLNLFKIKRS